MNELEEIEAAIQNYIKTEIRARLWDKKGGAAYDYANFCVSSDFDWLREEIDSDFSNLEYEIVSILSQELDVSEEEAKSFYEDNDDHISYLLKVAKANLMEEIDGIEENCDIDKIFDYIVNEVEIQRFNPTFALELLQKELIEKKVVKDLAELEKIESYQKAQKYVELHSV